MSAWGAPRPVAKVNVVCRCESVNADTTLVPVTADNVEARIAATGKALASNPMHDGAIIDLYYDARDLTGILADDLASCSACDQTVAIIPARGWSDSATYTYGQRVRNEMDRVLRYGTWGPHRFPKVGQQLGAVHNIAITPLWLTRSRDSRGRSGMYCMWHLRHHDAFGTPTRLAWSPIADRYDPQAFEILDELLSRDPERVIELMRDRHEDDPIEDVLAYFAALEAALGDVSDAPVGTL